MPLTVVTSLFTIMGIVGPGWATSALAGSQTPNTGCGPGWIYDVTNKGDVFFPTWNAPGIDNETGAPASESITNQVQESVSSTVDRSLGISISFAIAEVNAKLGTSLTQSIWVGRTILTTFTALPDRFLHVQYGVHKRHAYMHKYQLSGNCKPIDNYYGNIYGDSSVNWRPWDTYDG
jgi:hypothetical protein